MSKHGDIAVVLVAGLLTTLLDVGRAPCLDIQRAFQERFHPFQDTNKFQRFCSVLEKNGLIEQTATEMWLTEQGIEKAKFLVGALKEENDALQ